MLPANARRVPSHTADYVNERIRQQTEANIERFAHAGPEAIDRRLAELDREWDIERCVETLAPSLTLTGMTLGLTVNKRRFLLPFVVQAFFLQHAAAGLVPAGAGPAAIWRSHRSGNRRGAKRVKALRGDYRNVSPESHDGDAAHLAMLAARR